MGKEATVDKLSIHHIGLRITKEVITYKQKQRLLGATGSCVAGPFAETTETSPIGTDTRPLATAAVYNIIIMPTQDVSRNGECTK